MFTKLLKHEFKNTAGLLSILCACILGVGALAGVSLRIIIEAANRVEDSDIFALASIPAAMFLFVAYLSVIILFAAIPLVLYYRFYKTRFTDEGYLTFTLPVKTSSIFLSSAVNTLIWEVIGGCAVLLAVLLLVIIGIPAWAIADLPEDFFSYFFEDIFYSLPLPSMITAVLTVAVGCVNGIVVSMSSVVLGASIAKKHKLLAAIGISYGVSMVNSVISGILSTVMQLALAASFTNIELMLTLSGCISLLLPVLLIIGGYILSIHLMKHKLNLP